MQEGSHIPLPGTRQKRVAHVVQTEERRLAGCAFLAQQGVVVGLVVVTPDADVIEGHVAGHGAFRGAGEKGYGLGGKRQIVPRAELVVREPADRVLVKCVGVVRQAKRLRIGGVGDNHGGFREKTVRFQVPARVAVGVGMRTFRMLETVASARPPVGEQTGQSVGCEKKAFGARRGQEEIVIEIQILLPQTRNAVQKRFNDMGTEGGQILVRDEVRMVHDANPGMVRFQPGRNLGVGDDENAAHPGGVCFQRTQGVTQLLVVPVQSRTVTGFLALLFAGQMRGSFGGQNRVAPVHPGVDHVHREIRFRKRGKPVMRRQRQMRTGVTPLKQGILPYQNVAEKDRCVIHTRHVVYIRVNRVSRKAKTDDKGKAVRPFVCKHYYPGIPLAQISIIVLAARADADLSTLLKSMASFPADRTEAVIVRPSPDGAAEPFDASGCGVPVRFLTPESGTGMKAAIRLALEAAQGDIITFAAPGDAFPASAEFPKSLVRMREAAADIVHYAMACTDAPHVSDPWAEHLENRDIVSRYLAETTNEDGLFGKFYTRDLCRKAAASDFPADGHDAACLVLFAAALHFHAVRYAGIGVCGYVRRSRDTAGDSVARLMVPAALLQYCVPYCAQQGASFADCDGFDALLEARLVREASAWAALAGDTDDYPDVSRYGSEVDFLRAIILGHPEMLAMKQAYRSKRKRKMARRRIAPLWRSLLRIYDTLKACAGNLPRGSGRSS